MTKYNLDSLGWVQFEWLCQSILKDHLGLSVEAWGGRGDWGRDAFCPEDAKTSSETLIGAIVFQAKFVSGANTAGVSPNKALLDAIRAEVARIRKRAKSGLYRHIRTFVLLTNAPLAAKLRTSMEELLATALPAECAIKSWGGDDLCALLDASPRVRLSFPQILGLADLKALIAEAVAKPIIERSTIAIDVAAEHARTFVPTRAYAKAIEVLRQHHFVVLTGPPEMGKTTIARILGLAQLARSWMCFECTSPGDFLQMYQADEPQVFIADDAFGSTEFSASAAREWGAQMDKLLLRVDDMHWLVWTSRPTPLRLALRKMHLQGKADRFPHPADVTVDAAALSVLEKGMILYRHCKDAELDDATKEFIKAHAEEIVADEHFTPERARRFAAKGASDLESRVRSVPEEEADEIVRQAVREEIQQPTRGMQNSFDALSESHQHLLIAMLDAGEGAVEGQRLISAYERLYGREHGGNAEALLDDLAAHFVRLSRGFFQRSDASVADMAVGWMHPSFRDLVIDHVAADRSLRERFLGKCSVFGVVLAMSGGGGAEGGRANPFLKDPSDYEMLELRIIEILKNAKARECDQLLAAALELVHDCQAGLKLRRIARVVAVHALERWNDDALALSLSLLAQYYQLSDALGEVLPSPKTLESMWEQYWGECSDFDAQDGYEIETAREFIALAECLGTNEPRFVRLRQFPDEYVETISMWIGGSTEHLEWPSAYFKTPSAEESQEQFERLSNLDSLMGEIADAVPGLSAACEAASRRIRPALRAWEEASVPDEPDWDGDDDYEAAASLGVSIDDLFSDL